MTKNILHVDNTMLFNYSIIFLIIVSKYIVGYFCQLSGSLEHLRSVVLKNFDRGIKLQH